MRVDYDMFDHVHHLAPDWYADGPGTLKVNIYDILPDGDWLYLDADTLCIADIGPALERLKAHDFAMDVRGKGPEGSDLVYSPWATQETIKRVANLPDDATYYGVQSSWMWIRKFSYSAAKVFEVAKALDFRPEDLKEPWGQDIPDELRFAAALSVTGVEPYSEALSFYGSDRTMKGLFEVCKVHPLLCLYGDNRQHRLIRAAWFDEYDRYLRKAYMHSGRPMMYSLHQIMQNKYVNKVKPTHVRR